MLRSLLPLAALAVALCTGFFYQHPYGAAFPDPIVEGDTVLFRQMQTALQHAVDHNGPEKCYVQTDRTLYYPGDTLWFNAFLVNAGDLRPSDRSQVVYVSLYDPKGALVNELKLEAPHGTAAGEFDLGKTWPGGRYELVARTNWMRNDSASFFRRDIVLQKAVKPRINLKMEFERKAYGPGDEVSARFDAATLENVPLGNQTLQWTAYANGKTSGNGTAQTDAAGRAFIKFRLPAAMNTPDALLDVRIAQGGRSESISRPVPIVLNRVDMTFFPEGGDAVTNIPCRMAFKAVNEFGKAADVEGYVADASGRRVAEFSSFHNGMGSFSFTPLANTNYTAHLTKPVAQRFAIPASVRNGASLHMETQNDRQVVFSIGSNNPGTFYLTGVSRDKIFFFKEIHLKKDAEKTTVPIEDLPIGIARFTLFDANRTEMAERLVFLHRDRSLNIRIEPNQTSYTPREPVRLRLRVQDHLGRPVQGRFSVSVSDEPLLTFADDKQGHLLSSLLLEQDLKGTIEEPNFYFDTNEPKSLAALDYLMLTQGWRRFHWKKVLAPEKQEVARFEAERTDIRGVLVGNARCEALPGRVLTLLPDNVRCTTDMKGNFAFKNIEWNGNESKAIVDQMGVSRQIVYNKMEIFIFEEYPYCLYNCNPQGRFIFGKVRDRYSGEELIGATVKIMKNGEFIRGAITDNEGNYHVMVLPDIYDVKVSYTGYAEKFTPGVNAIDFILSKIDFQIKSEYINSEVDMVQYKVPVVKYMQTSCGLSAEQIASFPVRSVNQIVATAAGSTDIDRGNINIKGARAKGTNYYIDGVRVAGAPAAVETVENISAMGINAEFSNKDEEAEAKTDRAAAPVPTIPASLGDYIWEDNNSNGVPDSGEPPILNVRVILAPFYRARQFYIPKYQRDDPAPEVRSDFRNTLYWNPTVVTDAFGEATLDFVTSDAITNFRATVEGISTNGQPGRAEHKIFTEKPFSLEVKTPPYVISGDTLRLDAVLVHKTGYSPSGAFEAQVPEHFQLLRSENEGRSLVYRIGWPKNAASDGVVLQWRDQKNVLDRMAVHIPTLERGFPVRQVFAGQNAQNTFNLRLMQPIEGTLDVALTMYPSALEELLKGTERMLQQPSGCFEQVSSTNYPNLLVLDLLRRSGRSEPDIERRAKALLASGYQQLTGYECKGGGFDWWGREPAHEGLTAYGLLEFTDMKKVFPVDESLIKRTVEWLRSRRDGKGGWKINPESSHGWQNDGVLEAYMAWAVAEAGYGKDFSAEINKAAEAAWSSNDPYQMALLANALSAAKDPRAARYRSRLLEQQQADGCWKGKTYSVLYAYGACFDIETTALGALALMKTTGNDAALQRAMQYLIGAKTEYGYGSTQSTVLTLKALTEYTGRANMQPGEGQLVVSVDGQRVEAIPVGAKMLKRVEIRDLAQYITHDRPRIEVFFEKGKVVLPFDMEVKYAALQPLNTAHCALSLETTLAQSEVEKGGTVRLSAVVRNTTGQPAASPMLVVGIPAGLSLQPWQLKQLMDEKRCDFYELWDGKAVFHFEQLPANATRQIDLDLRADVAGVFEAPASQAFLYYQNDQRVWSKPERVRVGR